MTRQRRQRDKQEDVSHGKPRLMADAVSFRLDQNTRSVAAHLFKIRVGSRFDRFDFDMVRYVDLDIVSMCMPMQMCMYVYIYIYMYVYTHRCIYMYIYIYIERENKYIMLYYSILCYVIYRHMYTCIGEDQWCCEATLWLRWVHCGEMKAPSRAIHIYIYIIHIMMIIVFM